MVTNQINKNRPTLGGMLIQHAIVFLICIVFPGGVTFVAPATWITFERSGSLVHCKARTCIYFVVPFKIQKVDNATKISHRERQGRTERQLKHGRPTGKTINVQGEGFLQVTGEDGQLIEVSVSPASLENVVGRSNEFLKSTQESSTTIFAIANWKFGGLMGGVLTLLTVLYIVGYTMALAKWLVGKIKTASRLSLLYPDNS